MWQKIVDRNCHSYRGARQHLTTPVQSFLFRLQYFVLQTAADAASTPADEDGKRVPVELVAESQASGGWAFKGPSIQGAQQSRGPAVKGPSSQGAPKGGNQAYEGQDVRPLVAAAKVKIIDSDLMSCGGWWYCGESWHSVIPND